MVCWLRYVTISLIYQEINMPIVNIKIVEGRTVEQKRQLAKEVTAAICNSLGVAESAVWIAIEDMAKENFDQGGQLRLDK